jgi:hypothetical protein
MKNVSDDKTTTATVNAMPPRPITLRANLKELIGLNPDATDEDLILLLVDRARGNQEIQREAISYWLNRNIRGVRPKTPEVLQKMRAQRDAERERADREAAAIVDEFSKHITLRALAPNGRQFATCTFAEIATLGRGFERLSMLGAPEQKIGDAFKTDKELQAALAA